MHGGLELVARHGRKRERDCHRISGPTSSSSVRPSLIYFIVGFFQSAADDDGGGGEKVPTSRPTAVHIVRVSADGRTDGRRRREKS